MRFLLLAKAVRWTAAVVMVGGFAVAGRAQVVWSGITSSHDYFSGSNWLGGSAPLNNGSATPNFGIAVSSDILLSAGVNVSSLTFVNTPVSDNNDFKFTASSPQTLTLQNGLSTPASGSQVKLTFKSNVGVVLAGNQTWTLSNSSSSPSVQLDGVLSGAGTLTLAGNSGNLTSVTLNGHNTLSGGINANGVSLTIAQGDSLGTGTLALASNSNLIATAGMSVANALTLNGSLGLEAKGGTLNLTGPVTLTAGTSINTQPVPTVSLQPVVLSGNIGGAFSLGKSGSGNLFLTGTNSFSGANANGGGLVFGSAGSISGNVNLANNAYAGLAFTSGNVTTDFANFGKATTASVGYDTLPGSGTLTINTPINLVTAGFTNAGQHFGTATNLILGPSATLTPVSTNYMFAGASNGTLTIQSALTGAGQVQLSNPGAGPMHLYLQGSNSYTGTTLVSAGTLVFDGSGAVPASSSLNASSTGAYIGQTENTGTTDAAFVGQFNAATIGVIGFDSHTPASPRTVDLTGISFARFGTGAGIGTSTAVTITGTLTTPSSSGLRLATANGGALTVTSILGNTLGTVTLSNSASATNSGTITLNGANTYTAGTNFNGGFTAVAGSASAFGTGAITVANNSTTKLTTSGTFTLPNAITLGTGTVDTLQVGGANNFTLGGVISGGSSTSGLSKVDANTVSLTAANTFSGPTTVFDGVLQLLNDSAAGMAALSVQNSATVQFSTANPTVYGITADSGTTVSLAAGSVLTVSTPSGDSKIHGTLTGNGSTLNITGGKALTLDGTTTGINAVNVTNGAILVGSSSGLNSSAAITVNATGVGAKAGVAMGPGITLSNPITLTSGILLGYGTFTPGNGALTIGSNVKLYPGGAIANGFPGRLSFGNGLNFASGGDYEWGVVDANTSTGTFSTVDVTGTLAISATSGSPFTLRLTSYDTAMNAGQALNFNSGQGYKWTVASATSGITGFAANAFTIDGSGFQNPLNGGAFSLTANANNLFLNFTPVPEPPEWALLTAAGAAIGGLWLTGKSRRKVRA